MKNVILCAVALSLALCGLCDEQRSVSEFDRRTGGYVVKPRKKANKKIYFINAQNRATEVVIESARQKLSDALKTQIDTAKGSFNLANPKIEGELTFYIIDDESLPLSLIAPESRWAFVNVAKLTTGRGEKQQFFEARVRKEIARVACLLFGGVGSEYKKSLMGFVGSADALDLFEDDSLPEDALSRSSRYLLDMGVKPIRKTTYRDACMEGWAPAPTNDIQKAIWDEVHKVPEKPLKITYDRDKQKPVVK